jgi:hypothetical protein
VEVESTKLKRETAHRKQLQRELATTKRKLKRTRAELESAQAWIDGLEQRMRRIQQSPPYRFASRLWRLRAGLRAPLREQDGEARAPRKPESDPESWLSEKESHKDQPGAAGLSPSIGISRSVALLGSPSDEQLASTLAELRDQGQAGPELLVVTDSDALSALDQFDCRYEYVPPREDWEQLLGRDAGEYEDFLRRRLEMIGAQHGVTVDEADVGARN